MALHNMKPKLDLGKLFLHVNGIINPDGFRGCICILSSNIFFCHQNSCLTEVQKLIIFMSSHHCFCFATLESPYLRSPLCFLWYCYCCLFVCFPKFSSGDPSVSSTWEKINMEVMVTSQEALSVSCKYARCTLLYVVECRL